MDSEGVIRKTWQRLGSYARLEWRRLFGLIRQDRILLADARDSMAFLLGIAGVVWDLDEIQPAGPAVPNPPTLNVPPLSMSQSS